MKNLKYLYQLFNQPDLDINQNFKGADNMRMNLAKDLITVFLLRPTLEEISFDFDEVQRISKVWEGSSEEFFFRGHRLWDTRENIRKSEDCKNFMEANDETLENYLHEFQSNNARKNIFPKFKNVEASLACDDKEQVFSIYNLDIEFINLKDDYDEIDETINYITWEPSFLEDFCKEQRIKKLLVQFSFQYRFDDEKGGDKLESQLFNFIGPVNKAYLLKNSLQNYLDEKTNVSKSQNLKI